MKICMQQQRPIIITQMSIVRCFDRCIIVFIGVFCSITQADVSKGVVQIRQAQRDCGLLLTISQLNSSRHRRAAALPVC